MLIIPDTNALYADKFLEGPLVDTILAAESHTDIRLVIPAVVVDELRNQVEEDLDAVIKSTDKARRDYAELRGVASYLVDLYLYPDHRKAVLDRFEQRVEQLDKEGRILKYPATSAKELAHRSIKEIPPFQNNDRGMRDTLIWLTLKNYAVHRKSAGLQITLVTKDRAFLDKDDKALNEGLAEELKSIGIAHASVSVRENLRNVIDTFVVEKLLHAEWVSVAIEGGQIDDFTSASDTVSLRITDWIYDNPDIVEVGGYIFVEFDVVEDVVLHSIERTLELGKNEVLVESHWTGDVVAQGYDNPYFGETIRITMTFILSSIVQVDEGRLNVKSHEVTDAEVEEINETLLDE